MTKSLTFFVAGLLGLSSAFCQGLKCDKIWVGPNTYLISQGSTHIVLANTNFKNDGIFSPGQGTVHFTGRCMDSLQGSSSTSFFNLTIGNETGINFYIPPELPIGGPFSVTNTLVFENPGNKLILGNRDFILGPSASIVGAGNDNFIFTSDRGRLIKESALDFTFPVGRSDNIYSPVHVSLKSPSALGVRCLSHVLNNGSTGQPQSAGVVDASWHLYSLQGDILDLSLRMQWNASDELIEFKGDDCGIARYLENEDWDLSYPNIASKLGQGPFVISRDKINLMENAPGIFAVGSYPVMFPLRVRPVTILQGAFDKSKGFMNATLKNYLLLPHSEPYSNLSGFDHVGRGGDEVILQEVYDRQGDEAIVDWVFVELRSALNSSTVLETRSALLQANGEIVDVDGKALTFRGRESGNYYISIKHRNHLGIRSDKLLPLKNEPAFYYDFRIEQNQAFQGVQAFLGNNFGWGMYGGDANSDRTVKYSGPDNDQNALLNIGLNGNKVSLLKKVYTSFDLNLDGTVRYSGPMNDQNILLNSVLGGDKTKVIKQPIF